MTILDKAIFLVTMGGSLKDEVRRVQLEAMKTGRGEFKKLEMLTNICCKF